MPDQNRPDAVKFPSQFARADAIPRQALGGLAARADELLQVDRAAGERARCYDQGSYIFATREPGQGMFFGEDHDLRGQPRYEWADKGDGVYHGTLRPEARPPEPQQAPSPTEGAPS